MLVERNKTQRRKPVPVCDIQPDDNRRERERRGSSDKRIVPDVVKLHGERRQRER